MNVTSTRVIAIALCSRRCQQAREPARRAMPSKALGVRGAAVTPLGASQRLVRPRSPDARWLGPDLQSFRSRSFG